MSAEYPSVCVPKDAIIRGYIAGVRYVHAPLRFRYKAVWSASKQKYVVDVKALKGSDNEEEQADRITAEFAAEHLVSWDAVYPDGTPVDISADAISNELYEPVADRLGMIILGYSESDIDPEAGEEPEKAPSADELAGNS